MPTSRTGKCEGRSPVTGRGFTLLELVAVIFIISLLAALVFPSFSSLGGKRLSSDSGRMASLLRYLNDGAIYSKRTFQLKFDLHNSMISWDGPDGDRKEELKSLAGVHLQSRGEIKDGQVTVFFGPLGIQEGIEIRLRDKDDAATVTFNPVSGRAKIIMQDEG